MMRVLHTGSARWPAMVVLSLVLAAALRAQPTAKHPYGIDDFSALRGARALAVAPDGTAVLAVVRVDGQQGPPRREWHIVNTSGQGDRKLDIPEAFRPAGYMPDGTTLFFVGGAEPETALYVARAPGFAPVVSTERLPFPCAPAACGDSIDRGPGASSGEIALGAD